MTIQDGIDQKSSGLPALAGRVRAELRANRRAALGLLALGCLAAGYGLLMLDDSIGNLRQNYIEATHRFERLVASGREKDWPARAAASAQMRQALEARLWKSDSEGMARADLQDWITGNAREAGLDKVQVRLEATRPKGLPANLRQVTATITALDTEKALIAFLDRIAREQRLLVVDHLLARSQPVASLEMRLVAYTLVTGDGSAAK